MDACWMPPARRGWSTALRTATTSWWTGMWWTRSSEEELPSRLARGAASAVTVGTWERARARMRPPRPRLARGRYVAVLRIEGTIVDGRSGGLPVRPPVDIPLVGEGRAGDLTVVQAARQVAADKRAAAVVLYVN